MFMLEKREKYFGHENSMGSGNVLLLKKKKI